jgi:hypothetical protein
MQTIPPLLTNPSVPNRRTACDPPDVGFYGEPSKRSFGRLHQMAYPDTSGLGLTSSPLISATSGCYKVFDMFLDA